MARSTGVYPSRNGQFSVVINDKLIAIYPTEEQAREMMPYHKNTHRKAALENLAKIRKEQAEARGNTPDTYAANKKEYMKEYREKNKEKLKEKQKEYRQKNKAHIQEYDRNRKRAKNPKAKPRVKVSRANGSPAVKAPRIPKALNMKRDSDVIREEKAQQDHADVRSGKLREIRGSISEARLPVDPNRRIQQTENLPGFSWSRNHYERR